MEVVLENLKRVKEPRPRLSVHLEIKRAVPADEGDGRGGLAARPVEHEALAAGAAHDVRVHVVADLQRRGGDNGGKEGVRGLVVGKMKAAVSSGEGSTRQRQKQSTSTSTGPTTHLENIAKDEKAVRVVPAQPGRVR